MPASRATFAPRLQRLNCILGICIRAVCFAAFCVRKTFRHMPGDILCSHDIHGAMSFSSTLVQYTVAEPPPIAFIGVWISTEMLLQPPALAP